MAGHLINARSPRLLGPGIAALGAVVALSPYVWMESWRGLGFSPAYVPFHLWCWLPFVALAAPSVTTHAVLGPM
jgi:hypothetical protein